MTYRNPVKEKNKGEFRRIEWSKKGILQGLLYLHFVNNENAELKLRAQNVNWEVHGTVCLMIHHNLWTNCLS